MCETHGWRNAAEPARRLSSVEERNRLFKNDTVTGGIVII